MKIENKFKEKALDREPVKQGKLAEAPDSHFDRRSRNLTDATMGSSAFLVDDVEVGNSCHIGVGALQIQLRDQIKIWWKTWEVATLSNIQLNWGIQWKSIEKSKKDATLSSMQLDLTDDQIEIHCEI